MVPEFSRTIPQLLSCCRCLSLQVPPPSSDFCYLPLHLGVRWGNAAYGAEGFPEQRAKGDPGTPHDPKVIHEAQCNGGGACCVVSCSMLLGGLKPEQHCRDDVYTLFKGVSLFHTFYIALISHIPTQTGMSTTEKYGTKYTCLSPHTFNKLLTCTI